MVRAESIGKFGEAFVGQVYGGTVGQPLMDRCTEGQWGSLCWTGVRREVGAAFVGQVYGGTVGQPLLDRCTEGSWDKCRRAAKCHLWLSLE